MTFSLLSLLCSNGASGALAHPCSSPAAAPPQHRLDFCSSCPELELEPSHHSPTARPALLAHLPRQLFEQCFGKALDESGQPLWTPDSSDKAGCRDPAGYWLSVHTHHSAVGALFKHCLFMSDISKFRSHSPTPPAWVYTSTSAWSPYRSEGLSSPWRAIV